MHRRAARPAALLLAAAVLLLALAGAPHRAVRAQVFSSYKIGESIGVGLICPYVTEITGSDLSKACAVVSDFAKSLIDTPDDTCPDNLKNETGLGSRQRQPISTSSTGLPVPRPLTVIPGKGVPKAFIDNAKKGTYAWTNILEEEGATYNWLWQVIRNIKSFWPCSPPFGGALESILTPDGWDLVPPGNASAANGTVVGGVFTIPEAEARRYPIMTVMRQRGGSEQLVVAVRGSNTQFEWARNFMYNRTSKHEFPGEPFKGNAFKGETHVGFTRGFDELWPAIRDALDSQVLGGSALYVTFTGHSQGAAIATLLSYAAAAYLEANGNTAHVSLVTFGSPLVGDTPFNKELRRSVNTRRVVFESDPFTVLPCATKKRAKKSSMPACADALVPTIDTEAKTKGDGTAQGQPKNYWSDYQPIPGEIMILGKDMPVQSAHWANTRNVLLKETTAVVQASHVCAYFCFLGKYSGPSANSNHCLLKIEEPGSQALQGNGYCPTFDTVEKQVWPKPMLDRDIFVDDSDFPTERPPMWPFRTFKDAKSWSCDVSRNGRVQVEVEHKPLPGVTPDMMTWLYNNLEEESELESMPGKMWPNFLLFHPRDHIKFLPARDDLKKGPKNWRKSYATFKEFQSSGCTEQREDREEPFKCPGGANINPGVLKGVPSDMWRLVSMDQVNSNSTVRAFNNKGIKFGTHGCKKKGLCAYSTKTSHSWASKKGDDPALGLPLRTKQDVGIGAAGKNNNPRIVSLWSNGVDPMRKCARVALHFIEEYGTLPLWLPNAYNKAMGISS
ncbi:MAG: class 3-domain-containing protein [Monoraphidium minutum]|nr:MAG: class 3-domain-containing protein [Monoraphidium minutum]